MINEQLKCGLEIEICNQVRVAKNYCPRIVVLLRVLQSVCNHLNISLSDIPDVKNTIHIDSELREMIENVWNLQSHPTNLTTTNGDNNIDEYEKILAKDYVKPSDMSRFIGILLKRETKQTIPTMPKIYEMLAMDGYLGDDPKRYVDYLKCDDFKKVHVQAVRRLYRDGLCTSPEEIYSVLQICFGFKLCEHPKDEELKCLYESCVFDKFHQICEWKMLQSQDELKRKESGTTRKRKIVNSQEAVEQQQQQQLQDAVPSKKRMRKNKIPVKVQPPPPKEEDVEENVNFSSSTTDSEEDEM